MSTRIVLPWVALSVALVVFGCGREASLEGPALTSGVGGAVAKAMAARGLSEADVSAALKTYTPTGGGDDSLLFASGGHSGQLLVIGVPSMRILKGVGVFTPEPWQGYGYGDQSDALLASGDRSGPPFARPRSQAALPAPLRPGGNARSVLRLSPFGKGEGLRNPGAFKEALFQRSEGIFASRVEEK